MWAAAQRFIRRDDREQRIIIHLGDHDPSGIDMTRDIQERLEMFGADVMVKRVALTMEQIDFYTPPPNPAKLTDSRCWGYIQKFGNESWELDALEPKVITDLITEQVTMYRDDTLYQQVCDQERREKRELQLLCDNYSEAVSFLKEGN